MKIGHCFVLFIFISTTYVVRSEVLTAGVVAVASAVTAGFVAVFNKVNCIVSECCTDRWISPNFTGIISFVNKHAPSAQQASHSVRLPKFLLHHILNTHKNIWHNWTFHGIA